MDITEISALITDSVGAARILGCGIDQLRNYVKSGRLRCFHFDGEGDLVQFDHETDARGKVWLFLRQDVQELKKQKPPRGNPTWKAGK